MAFERTARIALSFVCATLWACSAATAPAESIDGTFVLESASGRGPASGVLMLTRGGYAERRVRFLGANGGMSQEYLARGTVSVNADRTVDLQLREMTVHSTEPWKPTTRLIDGGVEIRHPDPADGPDIIETYRRK